jgi:membrane-associated phospholipid phosphatase
MRQGRILSRSQRRSNHSSRAIAVAALGLAFFATAACSQSVALANADLNAALPDAPVPASVDSAALSHGDDVTLVNTPRNLLHDQAAIWTSPARLRPHDLRWLIPVSAAFAAAIATDHHSMTQVVSHDSSFNNANINTSNVLIGGILAAPVALYGYGHFSQDEHARETGLLGGEALVDGLVVEQGLKLVFWRERPGVDNSRGRFFQSSVGVDSSFPSSHSLLAWTSASALASEYHSPLAQIALYSGATAVSLTRVLGQEHFPSDVLMGATTGWLLGHYVVKRHHHPLKTLMARTVGK